MTQTGTPNDPKVLLKFRNLKSRPQNDNFQQIKSHLISSWSFGDARFSEQVSISNKTSMEDEVTEGHSFTCKIENAKIVIEVLQCLYDANKKSNVCCVEASVEGLLLITYVIYSSYY